METYIPDPCRLLLVNESDLQLNMIVNSLDHVEYEFYTAAAAGSVMPVYKGLLEKGLSLDAVVLDAGVSGCMDILKQLRADNFKPLIIILADDSMKNAMKDFLLSGAAGYVFKDEYETVLPKLLHSMLPWRVLTVDDNSMTREIIKTILNNSGIKVCQAANGSIAIEKCRELRNRHLMYDMLLLDVKMEGMDGISAFEVIKDYVPEAKGLIVTGHTSDDIIVRSKKAGAMGCIKKVDADAMAGYLPGKLIPLLPGKVLIADDSGVMREMVRAALEMKNYRVCGEAADGNEAFELYRAHEPQALVMDVQMPDSDGIGALKRIREYENIHQKKPAVIIMHSTLHNKETVDRCINAGANGYLIKPGDVDEENILEKFAPLLDKLRTLLKQGPMV